MTRLSSPYTMLLKLYPILLVSLIGFFVVGQWNIGVFTGGSEYQESTKLVVLVSWLLLLLYVVKRSTRLVSVWLKDDCLVVKGYRNTAVIPVAEVVEIREVEHKCRRAHGPQFNFVMRLNSNTHLSSTICFGAVSSVTFFGMSGDSVRKLLKEKIPHANYVRIICVNGVFFPKEYLVN